MRIDGCKRELGFIGAWNGKQPVWDPSVNVLNTEYVVKWFNQCLDDIAGFPNFHWVCFAYAWWKWLIGLGLENTFDDFLSLTLSQVHSIQDSADSRFLIKKLGRDSANIAMTC